MNGYKDELVWTSAWLYKATGKKKYLRKAKEFYQEISGQVDSIYYIPQNGYTWDDKTLGAQVM